MAGKQRKRTNNDLIKIVVVDDHPIMRQGLAQLVEQEKDMMICGAAEDANQALKMIRSTRPDVAIVDLSLKGTNGIELIKNIRAQYPNLLVLVLSMFDESLYAERALRAGARGYIMKAEASETIITALRKVMAGEVYLSRNMSSKMLHKLVGGQQTDNSSDSIESLTDRELEVFRLIGQGKTTRQIADELYLSVKTIESYRSHIKDKLDLANATELVQHAIQWVYSQNEI